MTNRAKGARPALGAMLALIALAAASSSRAQTVDEAATWDDTIGLCASCHGADGMGNPDLQAPRLAGQGQRYLAEQLAHFAQGRRGTHPQDTAGQTMAASAGLLDNAAIVRLAAYYASLGPPTPEVAQADRTEEPDMRGAAFYAANCAACHGQVAQGSDVLYIPNLALLDADYVRRQIEAYQKGWRGGPKASTRAKGMRQMSFQFTSEDEIDDLVQYLTKTQEKPSVGEVEL